MDKISPLSIWEISNNLKFGANKIKNTRKNISSITRINSHNNEKLLSWLKMNSGNKSKEKPKLFSLLDINDKITNSRGTSIPKQYRRLTDKEQQRIFGLFSRYNNNGLQKRKFINRSAENIFPQNEINIKNNPKNSKYEFDNNRYKFKKYSFSQRNYKLNDINNTEISKNDEKNKNKYKNKENENSNCMNKDREIFTLKNNSKKLKKAILIKSQEEKINLNNKNDNDKQNKTRDRWLPNGYESYELLIKHPKLFNKKLKMEYSMKKNLSAKTIKERANASDIFFFKPPTEKEVSFKTLERTKNLQNSDIFNIKNDTNNISKSGETYLFKKFSKTKYNIGNESNSYWKLPDNKIKSVISSSSKDYNILDPKSKGLYLSKEKMMIECENKKGNVNYMNPLYKQKGITEFIDITRNGANNVRKDYITAYNDNPKCFFKTNEVCASFYNCYSKYKNLCQKPFIKNFFN